MQKTQEMQIQSLGGEDPLEEEMATHSSILAQRIPWTEEPGGLQAMRSQSQTQLSTHTSKPWHDLKENKCYWRYMCFSPQIIFVVPWNIWASDRCQQTWFLISDSHAE